MMFFKTKMASLLLLASLCVLNPNLALARGGGGHGSATQHGPAKNCDKTHDHPFDPSNTADRNFNPGGTVDRNFNPGGTAEPRFNPGGTTGPHFNPGGTADPLFNREDQRRDREEAQRNLDMDRDFSPPYFNTYETSEPSQGQNEFQGY